MSTPSPALLRSFACLFHDLKHPLGLMKLQLDELDRTIQEPPPALKRLRNLLQHAMNLADDALLGEKLLQGDSSISKTPEDLNLLIGEVVQQFRAATRTTIQTELDPKVGQVAVDPAAFPRVVYNLLTNAIQHGGPSATITVRTRFAANLVTITVADSGVGMPPEKVKRLFDPPKSDHVDQGVGLGLYIVTEITRAHGGTISATSTEGKGTQIDLTLPV